MIRDQLSQNSGGGEPPSPAQLVRIVPYDRPRKLRSARSIQSLQRCALGVASHRHVRRRSASLQV